MFDNRKRPKPRSSADFRNGIICILGALCCLFNFKAMWIFFIMFIALVVVHFRFYIKHKASEEKWEDFMDTLEEDDEDEDYADAQERKRKHKKFSKDERKHRKAEYNKFLEDLDKDLGDFDDEELDDEEFDEDEE